MDNGAMSDPHTHTYETMTGVIAREPLSIEIIIMIW